jgi:hypothetical protein
MLRVVTVQCSSVALLVAFDNEDFLASIVAERIQVGVTNFCHESDRNGNLSQVRDARMEVKTTYKRAVAVTYQGQASIWIVDAMHKSFRLIFWPTDDTHGVSWPDVIAPFLRVLQCLLEVRSLNKCCGN